MPAVDTLQMFYDDEEAWSNTYPSDYESEEEYAGPVIPYTNELVLAELDGDEYDVRTPMTLEQWTEKQYAKGRDGFVDEDYLTTYIDRILGSSTIMYKGRELVLELWPLQIGSNAYLYYKGEHVEWVLDNMKTTYKNLDDLIFRMDTK